MRRRGWARWMLGTVLLAGCVSSQPLAGTAPRATAVADVDGRQVERLPLGRFFGNDAVNFHYRVSPDGTRLAWLASHRQRSAIFFRRLPAGEAGVIEHQSRRGVRNFVWAADSRRIVYFQDTDGDENYHVYVAALDAPDAPPRDLTPWPGARSWVHRIIRSDPEHVIVVSNRRDPTVFDLWRIGLTTGEAVLVAENPGDVVEWMTDWDGRPASRLRHGAADTRVLEATRDGGWAPLLTFDLEEMESRMLGVTGDGRALWMLSSRGRERRALVRIDLATGAEALVHEDPAVDIDWATLSQRTRDPLAIFTNPDYPRARFLHPTLAAAGTRLIGAGPAGVQIVSLDDADRRAVVQVFTDQGYENWLLDGDADPVLLGRSPSLAFADSLGRMEPVTLDARDGLRLHGYLTRPPGYREPGPLVIFVHGGHWLRDYWAYSPPVQFLASRGYAVLQVNYRGSTGYGRRFMEAAIGEYAGKMHDDLVDAVRWAVARGIADPGRVAIYGGSYGGYAALVGMTFTPDVFACGVSVVGMSNLVTLFDNSPPYWKLTWRPRFVKYMGDPSRPEDRARLEARSPLFKADRAQKPILIIHGARDARVKLSESEQMVAALQRHGKDVRFVVLADEGHLWDYGNWRNAMRHYGEVEKFLDGCLGVR